MSSRRHDFPLDAKLVRRIGNGVSVRDHTQQLLSELGSVVIVAPHPDDETLGCGGLIAACVQLGIPTTILAVTNGECSHPQSKLWSGQRIAQLRCEEQRQALEVLGLKPPKIVRLNLPDGQLGLQPTRVLDYARSELYCLLRHSRRSTVFVTSSSDDHPDHRTCAALVAAVTSHVRDSQVFHYSVWPPTAADSSKAERSSSDHWLLNIHPALQRKADAINCHRSQRGLVVSDDPEGFRMPADLIQRALTTHETFTRSRC